MGGKRYGRWKRYRQKEEADGMKAGLGWVERLKVEVESVEGRQYGVDAWKMKAGVEIIEGMKADVESIGGMKAGTGRLEGKNNKSPSVSYIRNERRCAMCGRNESRCVKYRRNERW